MVQAVVFCMHRLVDVLYVEDVNPKKLGENDASNTMLNIQVEILEKEYHQTCFPMLFQQLQSILEFKTKVV